MGSKEDSPHDVVCGKANSLEIFLFANGQQDSPPRKYNVRVNDRWDTILNFLARSQTGSNHTIELYTTDGKKIETGQELASGAAYVAVEPPQEFLPAGYNYYLMKASRSREKRQEKISNNGSLIKPGKDKMQEEIKDATNIKIIQDITIRSTSRTTVEEQDNITNQVKSDIAKAVKPIRRMSVKQPQKRNSSLPQQNPYILRKNSNNVTPPIKRGYAPSKVDESKKKVEISSFQNTKNTIASTKVNSIITKTNESKSKGDEAEGVIAVARTHHAETIETCPLQQNTDIASMPDSGLTGYKQTQNSAPESTVTERNILVPILSEKELVNSACIIPIKLRSSNLISNERNTVSKSNNPGVLILNSSPLSVPISPPVDIDKATERTESKPAFVTDKPIERCPKKTSVFGSQINENNFAIFIKQGEMVNLKLNVEVKNVSSTMFEANHNQTFSSSVDNTTLKKFEAKSTIVAGNKNYRDAITLTEPWLAGLPYEQLQQIHVGLCTCCSCFRNPESVTPVYVDNNNYFILLPPDEVNNEHLVSCTCGLEYDQSSKCELPDYNVINLPKMENEVIKLAGGTKSPMNSEHCEKRKKFGRHDYDSIENQIYSGNVSTIEGEGTQCECAVASAQYRTSPCVCAQELALQCSACGHEQATFSGAAKQNAPAHSKPTQLKEAFTQTYWSGIVLEARPGEDGSYAFHMPSLKVLKNTNYLY